MEGINHSYNQERLDLLAEIEKTLTEGVRTESAFGFKLLSLSNQLAGYVLRDPCLAETLVVVAAQMAQAPGFLRSACERGFYALHHQNTKDVAHEASVERFLSYAEKLPVSERIDVCRGAALFSEAGSYLFRRAAEEFFLSVQALGEDKQVSSYAKAADSALTLSSFGKEAEKKMFEVVNAAETSSKRIRLLTIAAQNVQKNSRLSDRVCKEILTQAESNSRLDARLSILKKAAHKLGVSHPFRKQVAELFYWSGRQSVNEKKQARFFQEAVVLSAMAGGVVSSRAMQALEEAVDKMPRCEDRLIAYKSAAENITMWCPDFKERAIKGMLRNTPHVDDKMMRIESYKDAACWSGCGSQTEKAAVSAFFKEVNLLSQKTDRMRHLKKAAFHDFSFYSGSLLLKEIGAKSYFQEAKKLCPEDRLNIYVEALQQAQKTVNDAARDEAIPSTELTGWIANHAIEGILQVADSSGDSQKVILACKKALGFVSPGSSAESRLQKKCLQRPKETLDSIAMRIVRNFQV